MSYCHFSLMALVVSLCVCSSAAGRVARADGGSSIEYGVKGAFIYNLSKFVAWPKDTFSDPHKPFRVCVFGGNPFGTSLEKITQGKKIHDRSIVVERITKPESLRDCHTVFIEASNEGLDGITSKALENASILTISDAKGFAQRGGMISLFIERDKVRFEVNLSAIKRARLSIESQALMLARIVE